MKKTLLAGLVAALFVDAALAFEPFQIKDIRVEGIQRTEAGTVFSYLPVKVGDTMSDEKAAAAIKALFATGFFKDVRLEIDGQVLVVVVDERPAIASLQFAGLKAFKPEDLKRGLREIGLAESRIFDRSLVERAEQELKRQYLSQGYYAAEIKTTITPLDRNRIGVNFAVSEGDIAKIREINIIGASAFSESDLRELMALRTPGWLTWFTKNDQYSKQKLSGDLETIRSHYLDRGYLEFAIESTQVSISPDKQDIYITINLREGEKYTVSSVKLAGNLTLGEDEILSLMTIRPGDVFSREKINQSTKAISDRLGNYGYAFANVNAAPDVDKEKREVGFTVFIDPSRRVNVRRINISGNTRTRDEVIRREMRQMESGWYDNAKIVKSKARVDKLGYFDEVTLETPAVAGTTDQIDIDVKVKEKPTGNLMIGAGVSSSEKLVLTGAVQQQNLFGSGKHVGFQVSTSKSNKVYSISHTDPYATVDGISRGFDLYTRNVDTRTLTVGSFGSKAIGGGLRFGIPIGEDDTINLGVSVDRTVLSVDTNSPLRYQDYVTRFGDQINTLQASFGWSKDGRDSFIYPTKGIYQRASFEVTGPGSTSTYYRSVYQYQRFFALPKRMSIMLNGEISGAKAYGDKELPFFKNFYAGGIGSVRGFDTNSLGPIDTATNTSLGGNSRVVMNAELYLPMPGSGLDKSMRISAFVDAGNVWGYGTKMSMSDLRYSTGLALTWSSPVGPLKFSFGTPLNRKDTDKVQRLQFQMGSTF